MPKGRACGLSVVVALFLAGANVGTLDPGTQTDIATQMKVGRLNKCKVCKYFL